MAYIIGEDKNQVQFVSSSLVALVDLIEQNTPARIVDAYVNLLDLVVLGFIKKRESMQALVE